MVKVVHRGNSMSDTNSFNDRGISRRQLLRGSGATIGLLGLGTGRVTAHSSDERDCSETTIRPNMVHYDDSIHQVCDDEHPESTALQEDVRTSLKEQYPTVGSLIDAGFIPYFDFFADGGWSHWINPEFIGDDEMVNPDRPESILVDHTWWRPIGVMFIATEEGDSVDPPPTIYVDEETEEGNGKCIPWHAHVGLPGRYSWWKYQQVYEGRRDKGLPCRTPWMAHVWIYPHEKSIYAHAAPEERGGPPAEDPGFQTDADPNEEKLGPEHLPDAVKDKVNKML